MIKRFLLGVTSAFAALALVAAPVAPLGNTHLHLGGGAVVVIQTAGTATLDGSQGSTFVVPTGPTNASFTLTASKFIESQVATVVIPNTSTNNTLVTLSDSGQVFWLSTNRTANVQLSYLNGTFYSKRLLDPQDGMYALQTNTVAQWPTNSSSIGGSLITMSNHVVYLLTSTPGSAAWAATNKLGP